MSLITKEKIVIVNHDYASKIKSIRPLYLPNVFWNFLCRPMWHTVCFCRGAVEVKMKNLAWLLLYALVTLFCHTRALSQVAVYGERGSDLGIRVFQQVIRSKPLDNVVLSPHGVASVLGMLLPGGHGETRKQILSALRYKKNGWGRLSLQDFLSVVVRKTCKWCWGPFFYLHRTLQNVEEIAQDLDRQVQPGCRSHCQQHVLLKGLPHAKELCWHQQS